jgi:hypothetical protein
MSPSEPTDLLAEDDRVERGYQRKDRKRRNTSDAANSWSRLAGLVSAQKIPAESAEHKYCGSKPEKNRATRSGLLDHARDPIVNAKACC